ncbi:MAG: VWA domain-containing protein [Actinobacteria bacterium]|nr:VWA domain-containing protein [Actinomycetota bacterium]
MSFGQPLLLLTLLVLPLAAALAWLLERRRMRYAIRYTNVDVLATVAGGRPWRRIVPGALFLLAVAVLCVALARPHMTRSVANDRATVILVLDVSGSMQAQDVKPTRLGAAQHAIHVLLDRLPSRLKVALILFAADAEVATPPTTNHSLVGQAVDDAEFFNGYGGTAIGDALATAVKLGREVEGERSLAAVGPRKQPLVSIVFLSDGHQNRGALQPLQGADLAKRAGFPVYTIALGTTGNTTLAGNGLYGGSLPSFGFARGLAPDPRTLRAIAQVTGGRFFRAKTAGDVQSAYSQLGSSLGRTRERTEVTADGLALAAVLLVAAGVLSALWAPRLP